MLIRLANHHVFNPHMIDKLIFIKGLPYDWMFKKVPQGDQLLKPWEPDADVNIPRDIRPQCEPITYCQYFQPVRHYDKTYDGFWDTRTVLGLKLDYGVGPAQEMWKRVEEFIAGTLPRTERIPVPVLVAPDQKSGFNPHLGRRNAEGRLELVPAEVPTIDLTPYLAKPEPVVVAPVVVSVPPTTATAANGVATVQVNNTVLRPGGVVPIGDTSWPSRQTADPGAVGSPVHVPDCDLPTVTAREKCDQCDYTAVKKSALRMHKLGKHRSREKVAA